MATVLLKGGGLLAGGRCDWGGREMGDVDVLVPARQAGRAAEILEDAGWRGVHGVSARYLADRLLVRRHGWNFEGPPSGEIDLHWHVFEGIHRGRADDLLWAAARPAAFAGIRTRRLDDAHQLAAAPSSTRPHGEASHRLMWIVDVTALLPHVDDVPFERVRLLDRASPNRGRGTRRGCRDARLRARGETRTALVVLQAGPPRATAACGPTTAGRPSDSRG